MLDDENYLESYSRLKEDRVKRRLGLLGPDEGLLDSSDRIQLMIDRHELPEVVNEESVRKRMGLVRKE